MINSKVMSLAKYFLIFMLALLVAFSLLSVGIADAVFPSNYVEKVKDLNNDWYIEDLDIESLKTTVNSWFDTKDLYNFEYFEEHPIIVAVIDSGVNYNHELFLGQYDQYGNPTDSTKLGAYDVFLRDSEGKIVCYNAYADYKGKEANINEVYDDAPDYHGSHVCGIISILIHELNLEKYIKILPIKASYPQGNKSYFPFQALQKAIVFALQQGATVVNMSLAGENSYSTLVSSSDADKAVFCAAAGNDGKNEKHYPACSNNVIGVMGYSLDSDGNPALYSTSNYGSYYNVVAPGSGIISVNGQNNNGYKKLNGTSMACPIVSFGAALVGLKYGAIRECIGLETSIADVKKIVSTASTRTVTKNLNEYNIFDINLAVNVENRAYCKIALDTNNKTQKINDVSKVDMHLIVFPNLAPVQNNIKWTITQGERTIKTGVGQDIEFLPLAQIGEINAHAEWTYDGKIYEDDYIVKVEYANFKYSDVVLESNSIVEQYNGNYIVGYQIINKLSGFDDVDPAVIRKIMWYVDGEYAGTNGSLFTYTPKSSGEHEVTAKLNGIIVAQFRGTFINESDIPKADNNTKKIIIICLIVFASSLALAVFITIIVLVNKKRKLSNEMKKQESEEFEADLIDLFGEEKERAMEAQTVEEYEEEQQEIEQDNIGQEELREESVESDETKLTDEEIEGEVLESEVIDPSEDNN